MSKCVSIDGTKDVMVGPDGRLLKRGTRRLTPQMDKEGRAYIELRSRTDPNDQEQRYLRVLVFEHHSMIPGAQRAQLGIDDVELVDPEKGADISNLRLTESGLEKIENLQGASETKNGEPKKNLKSSHDILVEAGLAEDEAKDEVKAEAEAEAEVEAEAGVEGKAGSEDKDNTSAAMPVGDDEEPEDEVEVKAEAEVENPQSAEETGAQMLTAKPTTEGGSHYDLLDAEGNSVLDTYNDGNKVNGKKNLNAIASEYAVMIDIVD